ncbi:unknown [Gryllus bimaculatus nudivirus]|uniref:Uncharacterized protein n=1 Tax=Gryllus bimaculatus nudivirus TaxID=432587 RepID=A4L210_9VIRU|nr:hypothetical protein GrBNV_gp47 [Gryllus bimaculatus nudivirus]ABO45380.1 unknown [Gryllus bimaculatus nudivirus]
MLLFLLVLLPMVTSIDSAYVIKQCERIDGNEHWLKCQTLKKLPRFNDSNVEFLDLNDNTISVIEDNKLQLENLRSLNIARSKISVVQSQSFRFLNKLEYINLSNNNISYLDEFLFTFNKKLRSIDVSYNIIIHIEFLILKHLHELSYLDVSFNNLNDLNFLQNIYYPSNLVFNVSNNHYLYRLNVYEILILNSIKFFNFNNCSNLHCGCDLNESFMCNEISDNSLKNYFHSCVVDYQNSNYVQEDEDQEEEENKKNNNNNIQVSIVSNVSVETTDIDAIRFTEKKTEDKSTNEITNLYVSVIGICLCIIIILLLLLLFYLLLFYTRNLCEAENLPIPEIQNSFYRKRNLHESVKRKKPDVEETHFYEVPKIIRRDAETKYINVTPLETDNHTTTTTSTTNGPYAIRKVLDGVYENTVKRIFPFSSLERNQQQHTYENNVDAVFSPSQSTSSPKPKSLFTFSSEYMSHQQMKQHNNRTVSKKKYSPPLNTCYKM